jgi:uncharacterized protein YidB (DUF937 family)
MAKGSPSMIALLGLLAVAGYQNRDKLSGMLHGAQGNPDNSGADTTGNHAAGGGLADSFRGMFAGAGTGGIASGLHELLGRFTNPVQSAKAQSWVDTGPNGELGPDDLAEVLDDETLADLTQKTGLSRSDLLARLSATLPAAVDRMTPKGRIPTEEEAVSL